MELLPGGSWETIFRTCSEMIVAMGSPAYLTASVAQVLFHFYDLNFF